MLQRFTEIKKFGLFGEADKFFEQLILLLVREVIFAPVVVVQSTSSMFHLYLVARLDSLAIIEVGSVVLMPHTSEMSSLVFLNTSQMEQLQAMTDLCRMMERMKGP